MKRVRYALIHKKSGSYAEFFTQEDLGIPVVGDSVEELCWHVHDNCVLREALKPGGEYEDYKIVRETIETEEISTEEMEKLWSEVKDYPPKGGFGNDDDRDQDPDDEEAE